MNIKSQPRSRTLKAPLRKITGVLYWPRTEQGWFAQQKVTLECGHEIYCSTATTFRARCHKCIEA